MELIAPKTFIFIGRSGCGKGTQVELLKKYINENDGDRSVFSLETGEKFREFIRGKNYSNRLSQKIYDEGGRQPDFLAVHVWSHLFIENLKGDEHIIIDGTPRSIEEAKMLDTAMKFYGRKSPAVVYLNISRECAKKRLLSRGRVDDIEKEIKKRLLWFDTDVIPAIDYYKHNSDYAFFDVDGSDTVENIHKNILSLMYGV